MYILYFYLLAICEAELCVRSVTVLVNGSMHCSLSRKFNMGSVKVGRGYCCVTQLENEAAWLICLMRV